MGNGTSIGRVRGLGSAHSGAHHWLMQHYLGIGSLLLSVWLVVSLILLPSLDYKSVREWLGSPVSAVLLGLFVLLLLLDLLENARLQLLQFAQFLEIVSHFGGDFGSYADWAAVRSHGGRLRKGMVNHADNWLTPS